MKTKWIKKAIPLTLSAGMAFGVPAIMPPLVSEVFVAQAFAAKAQATETSWDFHDGMEGWKYGGKWDYNGEPVVEASQELGLDFHYTIGKGGYAGIIKNLDGVDWSAYDAVQFWVQPDGKGQKLICQLNANGEDFEVDLTDIAKTKTPQLVTLPFAAFKGKNGGTFDKSAVQHFAIYCNTIGDAGIDSHIYFDDIRAVKK